MDPLRVRAARRQDRFQHQFRCCLHRYRIAWVDSMKVELDGEPYSNPQFDFDFESPKAKGFYTGCGGNAGCTDYKVGIDDTVSYYGHQSLKMQFVGDGAAPK